jgi:cell division septation protein DedD
VAKQVDALAELGQRSSASYEGRVWSAPEAAQDPAAVPGGQSAGTLVPARGLDRAPVSVRPATAGSPELSAREPRAEAADDDEADLRGADDADEADADDPGGTSAAAPVGADADEGDEADSKEGDLDESGAGDAPVAAEGARPGEQVGAGFWIQVASLRVKEKAERLAEQLRERGHAARAEPYGEPRAGWWHVVRMGPYATRLEAETARLALAREQTSPSMVLPRARGPYYLQLASLRSEPRAQDLATKLRRRGHYAYVRGVPSGQGTWHCVRIGPFDSQADALGYQKLLRERDGHEGEVAPRSHDPAD